MDKKAKFKLGQIVVTRGVWDWVNQEISVLHSILQRHQSGDWGELEKEDKLANDSALQLGARILSCYRVNNRKVWILTEGDRSVTTILLPEEY